MALTVEPSTYLVLIGRKRGRGRSNLKEVNLDLETQYLRAQRAEFRFTLAVPSRGNVEGVIFYFPYSMDTETVPDDSGLDKAAMTLPAISEGLTQDVDQARHHRLVLRPRPQERFRPSLPPPCGAGGLKARAGVMWGLCRTGWVRTAALTLPAPQR